MARGDDRPEFGLGIIRATDDALLGELLHVTDELIGDAVLHHADRQSHAAHAGAAERGVDDAGGGALERGVGQDKTVVLGFGLSLDAFAVSGSHGVDVLAHVGGAHEGHPTHQRMGEQDLRLVTAACDHVHDALGQPGFLQQFHEADRRGRHHGSGFKHEGVAGDDAERDHPAPGDHGREVEGGDACEHAERLAVAHRVVSGGDVHEGFALDEHGSGHTHFAAFDDLDDLAPGLIEVLAHFARADVGELLHVLLEQSFPAVEHLGALLDGEIAPGLEGFVRGIDGVFHFGGGAARSQGEHFARARVRHVHVFVSLRLEPLAVDEILQFDRVCHSYHTVLSLLVIT